MTTDRWNGLTAAQSVDTQERIDAAIRQTPLLERLEKAIDMIAKMCAELRPPKMSIPPQATDEDIFIVCTLEDVIVEIKKLQEA